MKHFLLSAMSILALLPISAQTTTTTICENPANDAFANVLIELPKVRDMWSGSKIIVTYQGDWPEEMIGAFEYAVKLWEEVLPMTIPISINANLSTIRGSKPTLSTIEMNTLECTSESMSAYRLPYSAIKSISLKDYNYNEREGLLSGDSGLNEILERPDISITYNIDMLDQFSFNLDEEIEETKYDFVSLALRDIALGLGFSINISANNNTKQIRYPKNKPTPYESWIISLLGDDLSEAYVKATNGSFNLGGKLNLYAPDPFVIGESLQYYIHDDSHVISRLLSHEFSKGYIMRDITYNATDYTGVRINGWDSFFTKNFEWTYGIFTGSNESKIEESGSIETEIPYKGNFTFDFSETTSLSEYNKESIIEDQSEHVVVSQITPRGTNNLYCSPYSFHDIPVSGTIFGAYYVLSAQLKDGTWDHLFTQQTYDNSSTITINVDDLTHNYPIEEYTRTTSGGLKYRLIKKTEERTASYAKKTNFDVKYFTRSYSPQAAKIKYSKIHNEENMSKARTSDEYYIDVEIGIRNIEGTTAIEVEQYDGDESLPFYYDVEDFRKGYFVANLDRECTTKLSVTSYNINGSTKSETIIIPAIGYPEDNITYNLNNNFIKVNGFRDSQIANNKVTYAISSPANMFSSNQTGILNEDRIIDTSSLPSGIYIISLSLEGSKKSNLKFIK